MRHSASFVRRQIVMARFRRGFIFIFVAVGLVPVLVLAPTGALAGSPQGVDWRMRLNQQLQLMGGGAAGGVGGGAGGGRRAGAAQPAVAVEGGGGGWGAQGVAGEFGGGGCGW